MAYTGLLNLLNNAAVLCGVLYSVHIYMSTFHLLSLSDISQIICNINLLLKTILIV